MIILKKMDLLEQAVALNILRFKKSSLRVKNMLKDYSQNLNFQPEFEEEEIYLSREEIKRAKEKNIQIIPFFEEAFPKSLLQIKDPPILIYIKGSLKKEDYLSVSIVGSRKCTEYGRSIARSAASELAKLGITIVSGLAYGIDAESHKGALEANGRTIAILGSGVDLIYPPSNKEIYNKIIEKGAVISEFPIGTKPSSFNFPFRNRLISAFSLATLVVEAEEKSGSLITAAFALEQAREVFAVPGNITSKLSKGTNLLIKDGATPFLSVDDILEGVKEFRNLKRDNSLFVEITGDEEKILQALENDKLTLEDISSKINFESLELLRLLANLEFKGFVKKEGGRFLRVK